MSVAENKALVREAIEETWNKANEEAVPNYYAPTFVFHQEGGSEVRGPLAMEEWIRATHGGFPDIRYTVDAMYGEDNKVATRYHVSGTQTGSFRGLPATGKPIDLTGEMIYYVQDGKIIEGWGFWDTLGLLEQLGLVQPPGAPRG